MTDIDTYTKQYEQAVRFIGKDNLNKAVIISMPNGDKYIVPCLIIAAERAKHYAEKDAKEEGLTEEQKQDRYMEELKYTLENNDEIQDWLENNTNWEDIENVARLLERKPATKAELKEGVINGEKEFTHF